MRCITYPVKKKTKNRGCFAWIRRSKTTFSYTNKGINFFPLAFPRVRAKIQIGKVDFQGEWDLTRLFWTHYPRIEKLRLSRFFVKNVAVSLQYCAYIRWLLIVCRSIRDEDIFCGCNKRVCRASIFILGQGWLFRDTRVYILSLF